MKRPFRPTRRATTALVAIALAVGLVSLTTTQETPRATAAAAGTTAPGAGAFTDMTVVGDSITALYNDRPGDARQGWWSIVGRHLGVPVERYAQSGSGYLKVGRRCTGDTFGDRPGALASHPDLLVLEGGRNDWSYCRDGLPAVAPDGMVEEAVTGYMDAVRDSVPATTRVIVLGPPWGPEAHEHAARVTAIVRAQAEAHGFEFVDMTDVLDASTVYDGTHPDREGSRRIAQRLIAHLEGARA